MQRYVGMKIINATPMTRGDYNTLRGWKLPADEDGADAGFLVEYTDGGKANVVGYDGYVSWSPADVFARAYLPATGMGIGGAVAAMTLGKRVAREGWNGKGMFLFLVPGSRFTANRPPLLGIYPEGQVIDYLPHVDMKTATGEIVPWLCSQSDMLAVDWVVLS